MCYLLMILVMSRCRRSRCPRWRLPRASFTSQHRTGLLKYPPSWRRESSVLHPRFVTLLLLHKHICASIYSNLRWLIICSSENCNLENIHINFGYKYITLIKHWYIVLWTRHCWKIFCHYLSGIREAYWNNNHIRRVNL